MHPIFLEVGSITIHWYGVMMALALVASVGVWHALARRAERPAGYASDVGVWLMVSGLLGARAAYVLANFRGHYADRPWEILRIDQGGLVFYGGLVGAALGMACFARLRGERVAFMADLVITPIPLAHAIGRIGCFLNGCCFGQVTECRVGVALHDVVRHPVQLYEAALNTALFALLVFAYPRRRREGEVFALYLLGYGVIRLGLERLRGDERILVAGLSLAQWVSVALLVAGAAILMARRGRRLEAHGNAPASDPAA